MSPKRLSLQHNNQNNIQQLKFFGLEKNIASMGTTDDDDDDEEDDDNSHRSNNNNNNSVNSSSNISPVLDKLRPSVVVPIVSPKMDSPKLISSKLLLSSKLISPKRLVSPWLVSPKNIKSNRILLDDFFPTPNTTTANSSSTLSTSSCTMSTSNKSTTKRRMSRIGFKKMASSRNSSNNAVSTSCEDVVDSHDFSSSSSSSSLPVTKSLPVVLGHSGSPGMGNGSNMASTIAEKATTTIHTTCTIDNIVTTTMEMKKTQTTLDNNKNNKTKSEKKKSEKVFDENKCRTNLFYNFKVHSSKSDSSIQEQQLQQIERQIQGSHGINIRDNDTNNKLNHYPTLPFCSDGCTLSTVELAKKKQSQRHRQLSLFLPKSTTTKETVIPQQQVQLQLQLRSQQQQQEHIPLIQQKQETIIIPKQQIHRLLPKDYNQIFPANSIKNTLDDNNKGNRDEGKIPSLEPNTTTTTAPVPVVSKGLVSVPMTCKKEKNRLVQYNNHNSKGTVAPGNATTVTVAAITDTITEPRNGTIEPRPPNIGTSCTDTSRQHVLDTVPMVMTNQVDQPALGAGMSWKHTISPQTYLDTLLRSRGYGVLSSDCYEPEPRGALIPSQIQSNKVNSSSLVEGASVSSYSLSVKEWDRASFGFYAVGVVTMGDVETLQTLLEFGLSPNASNGKGESLCQIVCRHGDYHSLKILLKFGCTLDIIIDESGRNPLHDACSCMDIQASLATVRVLLEHCSNSNSNSNSNSHKATTIASPTLKTSSLTVVKNDIQNSALRLFYKPDLSGALPLSFVSQEHWGYWIQFLASIKDDYIQLLEKSTSSSQTSTKSRKASSYLENKKFQKRNSDELLMVTPSLNCTQPKMAIDIIRMVAEGKISLEKARMILAQSSTATCTADCYDATNRRSTLLTGENDQVQSKVVNESNFHEIALQIENNVVLRANEAFHKEGQPKGDGRHDDDDDNNNIHFNNAQANNDADSTAYPDTVSGVEFYSDIGYSDDDYNSVMDNQIEKRYDAIDSRLSSHRIDSTIMPVPFQAQKEFYPRFNKNGTRNETVTQSSTYEDEVVEVDSTAYPDDSVVTGVEFYSESVATINSNDSASDSDSRRTSNDDYDYEDCEDYEDYEDYDDNDDNDDNDDVKDVAAYRDVGDARNDYCSTLRTPGDEYHSSSNKSTGCWNISDGAAFVMDDADSTIFPDSVSGVEFY